METPPPTPDCRAYLLIELLADGSIIIRVEGDTTLLWDYLATAWHAGPAHTPREAA